MSTSNHSPTATMSPNNTNMKKKRLACDNCHASKVRCTGEIHGCQRCQRGNRFCHYSESMMGKTLDGSQKRRKSNVRSLNILASSSNTSHGGFDKFDWTSTSSRSTSTSTNHTDPFSISMASPELERLWDESGNFRHESAFLNMSREPSRNGSASTFNDIDFEDIDALLDSPPDAEYPQLVQHAAASRPNYTHSTLGRSTEEILPPSSTTSWTTALEDLSRISSTSTIALDELLHISSMLLPQALRLPASDPSSMTPLLLILLCLTQIIALFEQCIPSVVDDSATCGSQDISLRLGAFQVDREAQQVLQKHIISKELSRILQASKSIKQALQQPGLASIPKRTHTLLIDDLHARIKTLVQIVKEKWSATHQPLTSLTL